MNLNSNTQSLEGKTNRAWKKIAKGVSTLMIPIWLGTASPVMLSKSVNANTNPNPTPVVCAHHDDGQSLWKRIKGIFKKDYTIDTLKVQIGHGPFIYVKEGQTIKVPYDKDFYVLPQKKHKLTTEILIKRLDGRNVKDKYGKKLVTKERINPEDYCIKEGEMVRVFVTYEKPTKLFGSTYFYVIQGKKPGECKPEEPEKPVEVAKKIIIEHRYVYEPTPEKPEPVPEEKIKKEKKPSIPSALIRLGYAFKGEIFTDKTECIDPERTGQGLIAQGTYAGRNYELMAKLLSVRYDDQILIPGMGMNVLRENRTEFEAEIKGKASIFALALNYKSTNNEWEPLRDPHIILPPMEKYTSNVLAGGVGLVFGELNKSFFEVLGYYGIGKLNEKLNVPGKEVYYFDTHINSQTITEWFGKAHTRLYLGKLLVELEGIYGEYDSRAGGLDGRVITLGGSVGFSLIKNTYVSVFYQYSDIEDALVKLKPDDLYGFTLIFNF
nr:hypothetical protein [Nanoarchaeota archaeon]